MNNREINLANKLFNEENEEPTDVIKIYYADLDLDARAKILKAINNTNDNIDVFTDELVRDKIEEQLKSIPLLVTRGQEIINKANIEF